MLIPIKIGNDNIYYEARSGYSHLSHCEDHLRMRYCLDQH